MISIVFIQFYQCSQRPEKSDSGIDAEIVDDLEKLYRQRHNYECGGAKTPYCLIKIGLHFSFICLLIFLVLHYKRFHSPFCFNYLIQG